MKVAGGGICDFNQKKAGAKKEKGHGAVQQTAVNRLDGRIGAIV